MKRLFVSEFVFLVLALLIGCASPKPQTIQELIADDRGRVEQEFEVQKKAKENTGVVTTREKTGGLTVSDLFHKSKETRHFYIRMECERYEREFVMTILKNKKIHWRVGSEAEGDAVSDREGLLEFSYVTTEAGTSPLVIEYQNSSYTLPITTGPMILVIPRDRCGRDVEKDPSGFIGENPPSPRPTDQ